MSSDDAEPAKVKKRNGPKPGKRVPLPADDPHKIRDKSIPKSRRLSERMGGQDAMHRKLDELEKEGGILRDLTNGLADHRIAHKRKIDIGFVRMIKTRLIKRRMVDVDGDRKKYVAQQLMYLEELRYKALVGWRMSMKPKMRQLKEWVPVMPEPEEGAKRGRRAPVATPIIPVMQLVRKAVTLDKSAPSAEFLKVIFQTIELECKLYGLFVEVKVENNNVQVVNWDGMRKQKQTLIDPVYAFQQKLIEAGVVEAHGETV